MPESPPSRVLESMEESVDAVEAMALAKPPVSNTFVESSS